MTLDPTAGAQPKHEEEGQGEGADKDTGQGGKVALHVEGHVRLTVHPLFERVAGVPLWALAWHTAGEVHVRSPFQWVFFALARLLHELAHDDMGQGNEMHAGHTWHFCARSWHALRLNATLHATRGLDAARALRRDGFA